ncbi:hypothetical protein IscW_ISCW019724, partial [Ixodes scapularis]
HAARLIRSGGVGDFPSLDAIEQKGWEIRMTLTFDTAPDSSRGGGTKRVTICEKPSKNPAAVATATSDAISQKPGVQTTPSASTSPVSDVQPRNSPGDVSRVSVGTTASPTKGSEQTEGIRQTPSPPKSGGSATASSPSYTPFYLNRPSSLMSRTRSPFLSYLSRNASPTKTSSTPSPPSPARSPGLMGSCREATQLTPRTTDVQECPEQSSPTATTPHTSPRGSPQTSPQTTPPAVPPPPPPLTYSSKVLERGSARLPSVTNEPNSVFTQSSTSSRVGARVTLDPEGKVIYSSNSLGRRRDGQPVNFGSRKIPCPSAPSANKYATLPPMVSPPIGSTWVSGLPPPPFGYPVTSSPQHASPPNFVQHPAQTRVPQQFNGRTTPVQRYTPPSDPYIPCPGSPARGYPSMPPYFAPPVASWDSGRTTPTQKNPAPNGPCDTGA